MKKLSIILLLFLTGCTRIDAWEINGAQKACREHEWVDFYLISGNTVTCNDGKIFALVREY